jgi:hypothetical protein
MSAYRYLAYGSNLHPLRLGERADSADLLGVVVLGGYRLTFQKRSIDGSGKCNLLFTEDPSDLTYAALYEVALSQKSDLDRFEGNGYRDHQIEVSLNGDRYTCVAYTAKSTHVDGSLKPYHWYKSLVVLGAEYLEMPEDYISVIRTVESLRDPDSRRRATNEELIRRLSTANGVIESTR